MSLRFSITELELALLEALNMANGKISDRLKIERVLVKVKLVAVADGWFKLAFEGGSTSSPQQTVVFEFIQVGAKLLTVNTKRDDLY